MSCGTGCPPEASPLKSPPEKAILTDETIPVTIGGASVKLPVILLMLAAAFCLPVLLGAFVCFRIVFYASRRNENHEEISVPNGKDYQPYREEIIRWTKRKRALPQETFSIQSADGLTLRGPVFRV